MGNFGGHALPGSFFIIFGIWFVVRTFQSYYKSRARNTRFTSQVMMGCPCLCGRLGNLPMEAFVKIFFISIGFTLEIYTGVRNGYFVSIGNGQHATMFFFFGLTGIIDILKFYKAPLPKNTDYISNALALGVEGLLFKFHLHGRTDLDVLIHTLLVYAIFINMSAVLVEMNYRHSILAALAKSYFLIVQGVWFWQVAFILYNPFPNAAKWEHENHDHMMLATLYFTWNCGASFVFILLIGSAIACCYGTGNNYTYRGEDNDMSMKRLIHTSANGQTMVSIHDDSESDVEFQKPVSK